jgi:hypothetical protein
MITNILVLSLLSAIIILFYIGMKKNEYFEDQPTIASDPTKSSSPTNNNNTKSSVTFKPRGETISECTNLCKTTEKYEDVACEKICRECNDTDCVWVTDSLKPHPLKLSVKPLVNALAVSWNPPKSEYNIIKYTVLVQKANDNENKSFYFPIPKSRKGVTYQILDLNPNEIYNVSALSSNRFGDSMLSNQVLISPLKKGKKVADSDKVVHELAYQRGEYTTEDLEDVLEKVIESKKMQEPYRVTVRY